MMPASNASHGPWCERLTILLLGEAEVRIAVVGCEEGVEGMGKGWYRMG